MHSLLESSPERDLVGKRDNSAGFEEVKGEIPSTTSSSTSCSDSGSNSFTNIVNLADVNIIEGVDDEVITPVILLSSGEVATVESLRHELDALLAVDDDDDTVSLGSSCSGEHDEECEAVGEF